MYGYIRRLYQPHFFLSNDVYLVILDEPTVFHLSCKKADSEREQINPPFGFF